MCGIFYTNDKSNHLVCYQNAMKLKKRGPDSSSLYIDTTSDSLQHTYVFHHLGIIHPKSNYNQPFFYDQKNIVVLCNGEIYNWKEILEKYGDQLPCDSELLSDCDIIGYLYILLERRFSNVVQELEGEFSIILHDKKSQKIYACRDFMGVRPLFFGVSSDFLYISSEVKGIPDNKDIITRHIEPRKVYSFDSNHSTLYTYENYWNFPKYDKTIFIQDPIDVICDKLYNLLYQSISLKLQSERPIGCLLSGGIDSSLVVAIASKINPNIRCFTIGSENSPDIVASRKVSQYLNVPLDIIPFDNLSAFEKIPEVIRNIETYDITTIRASTPQYLIARWISQNTNIKVILSGEGSDEIFSGYIYSKLAPNPEELWKDGIKLLSELYLFDCLRTDRTMSSWGIEVRVPFLYKPLVQYALTINPELRMSNNKIEKYILRRMIEKYKLLPKDITWRPKEAFSDSVSSTKNKETWREFIIHKLSPIKEDDWYKKLFIKYYPFKTEILSHYWLPNWVETNNEPSATILEVYQNNQTI